MSWDARSERLRFGKRFVILARQWRKAVDAALAEAGLTDASWSPLVRLAEDGDGISQTELAACLGLDSSSLVRLIDLLERRGLIERHVDPSDRRARRLKVTELGREEHARIRAHIDRMELELLSPFDDDRIALMSRDLDMIDERVQRVLERGQAA